MAYLQQVPDSEEYRRRVAVVGRARAPSHIEFGALILQAGLPPAGITRFCRALRRLGIAHSEDGAETPQTGTIRTGVNPLPKGACPACRGRHRAHTYDHRCHKQIATSPQALTAPPQMAWLPARHSGTRRWHIDQAGPHFRQCLLPLLTPDTTLDTARSAMRDLATRSTPYAAAAHLKRPPQGRSSTPRPAEQIHHADAGGSQIAQSSTPSARLGEANPAAPVRRAEPALLPTANELQKALAETVASAPWNGDGQLPTLTRNRPPGEHATRDPTCPPPQNVGLPPGLALSHPGLQAVTGALGARRMECGATNWAEAGAPVANQCFYLALAAAVANPGESHHLLARELRGQIEGAVRSARPDWAAHDFLGQEVGAFADFLIWGLQAAPRLRHRTVAVYQATNGTCEVFRSFHQADRQAPVIALWFSGPEGTQLGHYYWLAFRPPAPTTRQLLALHRRREGDAPRVATLVTDALG